MFPFIAPWLLARSPPLRALPDSTHAFGGKFLVRGILAVHRCVRYMIPPMLLGLYREPGHRCVRYLIPPMLLGVSFWGEEFWQSTLPDSNGWT